MGEVTYYFNSWDGINGWDHGPDNMVDGSLGELFRAQAGTNGVIEICDGNTCPGTDLGTITKIELRCNAAGDGTDRIHLTPLFLAGDGDEHQLLPPGTQGWTAYCEITNDLNAPDWSFWSHVQDLGVKVKYVKVAKQNAVNCWMVEIRATFTPIGPPAESGMEAQIM